MDSIWNLWNYVEYVESTWNLWGSVKYTYHLCLEPTTCSGHQPRLLGDESCIWPKKKKALLSLLHLLATCFFLVSCASSSSLTICPSCVCVIRSGYLSNKIGTLHVCSCLICSLWYNPQVSWQLQKPRVHLNSHHRLSVCFYMWLIYFLGNLFGLKQCSVHLRPQKKTQLGSDYPQIF